MSLAVAILLGGMFLGQMLWALAFRATYLLWTALRHRPAPLRYGLLPWLLLFSPLPGLCVGLIWFSYLALSGQLRTQWIFLLAGVYAALAMNTLHAIRLLSRSPHETGPLPPLPWQRWIAAVVDWVSASFARCVAGFVVIFGLPELLYYANRLRLQGLLSSDRLALLVLTTLGLGAAIGALLWPMLVKPMRDARAQLKKSAAARRKSD